MKIKLKILKEEKYSKKKKFRKKFHKKKTK